MKNESIKTLLRREKELVSEIEDIKGKKKEIDKNLLVVTDVCMCEYTSHGHCGIIHDEDVDNDETLEYIAKISVSHAKAGADIIAPSDMMDGRILAIRNALDNNGFKNISIMSYSAKYCSFITVSRNVCFSLVVLLSYHRQRCAFKNLSGILNFSSLSNSLKKSIRCIPVIFLFFLALYVV